MPNEWLSQIYGIGLQGRSFLPTGPTCGRASIKEHIDNQQDDRRNAENPPDQIFAHVSAPLLMAAATDVAATQRKHNGR